MASTSSADMETSTPQPTLRAPGGAEALSAYEAAKAKEADKKLVLELLQAPELFSLADASSAEAANRGTPVSLLHAILRVYLGAFGLNWERFLVGGILGKTIADAIKLRLASGELPITKEPLASSDANIVPGQNKASKKAARKKLKNEDFDGDKKVPRDSIFNAHHQKYRAGLILNTANVSEQGNAARFCLPFISPTDSLASSHLKAVFKGLGITDLSQLSFNVEEKTREPEATPAMFTNQSSPTSSSQLSALEGLPPYVGEYAAEDVHEFFVQPPHGTIITTDIQREGPRPDCAKSLIITGSVGGAICDELVPVGDEMVFVQRQFAELQRSSFPVVSWKLCIPLSSDLDLTSRGTKRLASGVHVFTIKKKKAEPAVATLEKFQLDIMCN